MYAGDARFEGVSMLNTLGGGALFLLIGYMVLTQLNAPDGPDVHGLPDSTFKRTVLMSDMPVLVDFYADGCGPCKAMAPILDEFARRNTDVVVMRIDVEKNNDLAYYCNIRSIPTLMVFKKGKVTARRTGIVDGNALKELVGK
jgi:thioredoxin 1